MKGVLIDLYRTFETDPPVSTLAAVRYPEVARNVWNHVVRLFESDLEYMPPSLSNDERGANFEKEEHGR